MQVSWLPQGRLKLVTFLVSATYTHVLWGTLTGSTLGMLLVWQTLLIVQPERKILTLLKWLERSNAVRQLDRKKRALLELRFHSA